MKADLPTKVFLLLFLCYASKGSKRQLDDDLSEEGGAPSGSESQPDANSKSSDSPPSSGYFLPHISKGLNKLTEVLSSHRNEVLIGAAGGAIHGLAKSMKPDPKIHELKGKMTQLEARKQFLEIDNKTISKISDELESVKGKIDLLSMSAQQRMTDFLSNIEVNLLKI